MKLEAWVRRGIIFQRWVLIVSAPFIAAVFVALGGSILGFEEFSSNLLQLLDIYISPVLLPILVLYFLPPLVLNIFDLNAARQDGYFSFIYAFRMALALVAGWAFVYVGADFFLKFEPEYHSLFFHSTSFLWVSLSWCIEGTAAFALDAFEVPFAGAEATKNELTFNVLELIARGVWGIWMAYLTVSIFARLRQLIEGRRHGE